MYVVIHYSESDFDIHCCIVICMFTYNEVGEATCVCCDHWGMWAEFSIDMAGIQRHRRYKHGF